MNHLIDIMGINIIINHLWLKIMKIKDHYVFYRDNFINDQVGFEPMFPKIHPRFVGWWSGQRKRGTSDDSTQIGPDKIEGETLDHKEV